MTIEKDDEDVVKLREAYERTAYVVADPVRGRLERYATQSTAALLDLFDAVEEFFSED